MVNLNNSTYNSSSYYYYSDSDDNMEIDETFNSFKLGEMVGSDFPPPQTPISDEIGSICPTLSSDKAEISSSSIVDQPPAPANPYGMLEPMLESIAGSTPLFSILLDPDSLNKHYHAVKNYPDDVIKGLQHEGRGSWANEPPERIESLLLKTCLAFFLYHELPPVTFLQNLLDAVFPNYGIDSNDIFAYVHRNVVFQNMENICNLTSTCSKNHTLKYALTIFACLYNFKPLLNDIIKTKKYCLTRICEKHSPLELLAAQGNLITLQELKAAKKQSRDRNYQSHLKDSEALLFSIKWNRPETTAFLLKEEIAYSEATQKELLIEAISKNHKKILDILLEHFPFERGEYFELMSQSIHFGNYHALKKILSKVSSEINLQKEKEFFKNLIVEAISRKADRLFDFIFSHTPLDENDCAELIVHSINAKDYYSLKVFLFKLSIEKINSLQGKSLLNMAIEADFEEGVFQILQHGVDPASPDSEGTFPLHAAFYRDSAIIQKLLLGGGKYPHTYLPDRNDHNIFDIILQKQVYQPTAPLFSNLLITIFSTIQYPSFQNAMVQLETTFCKLIKHSSNNLQWLLEVRMHLNPLGRTGSSSYSCNVGAFLDQQRFQILSLIIFRVAAAIVSEHEIIKLSNAYYNEDKDFFSSVDPGLPPYLHILIQRHFSEAVIQIVSAYKGNTTICDGEGKNILQQSILHRNHKITQFLLRQFSHMTSLIDNQGLNALHYACWAGEEHLISQILDIGCDINAQTANGDTALHFLCRTNKDQSVSVKLLLDRGAQSDVQNLKGITPLLLACDSAPTIEMLGLLLQRGASPFTSSSRGVTPLHLFCLRKEKIDQAFSLLLQYIDVLNKTQEISQDSINARDENGYTPLLYAMMRGKNSDFILELLERGANLKSTQEKQLTPLHVACWSISLYYELIPKLIELGADPYAEDEGGLQPIYHAMIFTGQSVKIIYKDINSGSFPPFVIERMSQIIGYRMTRGHINEKGSLVLAEYNGKNWKNQDIHNIPFQSRKVGLNSNLMQLLSNGVKIKKDFALVMRYAYYFSNKELTDLAFSAIDEDSPENAKRMLDEALVCLDSLPHTSNTLTSYPMPLLRKIVEKGGNIDAQDSEEKTLLLKAFEKPKPQITWIIELINLGANINFPYPGQSWKTPYTMFLETHAKLDVLRYLMSSKNPNINPRDGFKNSLLHHALIRYLESPSIPRYKYARRIMKQIMMKNINDFNLTNREGVAPIHLMCRITNEPNFESLLIEILRSSNINMRDSRGYTPFLEAYRHSKNITFLNKLHANGGDCTLVTNSNESILHLMAHNMKLSSFEHAVVEKSRCYLLSIDEEGNTPAQIAFKDSKNGLWLKMMELILNALAQAADAHKLPLLKIDASSKKTILESEECVLAALSDIPYKKDVYIPVFEYFAASGKHAILQEKLLPRMKESEFLEILNNFEEKGYRDIGPLKVFFTNRVLFSNFKIAQEDMVIPPASEKISIDELWSLYQKLDGNTKQKYQAKLKDAEAFINRVKLRKPYTGVPDKINKPEEHKKFYDTLENLVKHLIENLKQCDNETIESHLIPLLDTFQGCGTRWITDFTILYDGFKGDAIARSFPEELFLSLQKLRQGIVEMLDSGNAGSSSNSHNFNKAKFLIGKFAGIPTPAIYDDTTIVLSKEQEEELELSYKRQFKEQYAAARIISHLRNTISFLYKNEISQTIISQWLPENVPVNYMKEHYEIILNEVVRLEKEGAQAGIDAYLDSVEITPLPGERYVNAILDHRKEKYKMDVFDLSDENRVTFKHEAILDILLQLGVLEKVKFAPMDLSRKRKREQGEEESSI